MAYWLVKSEPDAFSWDQQVANGVEPWTGVRNHMARNNLRAMKKGDLLLYYHSNEGKAVVGIATVAREAYPDPSAPPDEDWSVIDVAPVKVLTSPVTLETIKKTPKLAKLGLVTRPRLSVMKVSAEEFDTILTLGKTSI